MACSIKRNLPGRQGVSLLWHITIATRGGEVLEHVTVQNFEEVKAVCTERRSANLFSKIFFRSPTEAHCEEWA